MLRRCSHSHHGNSDRKSCRFGWAWLALAIPVMVRKLLKDEATHALQFQCKQRTIYKNWVFVTSNTFDLSSRSICILLFHHSAVSSLNRISTYSRPWIVTNVAASDRLDWNWKILINNNNNKTRREQVLRMNNIYITNRHWESIGTNGHHDKNDRKRVLLDTKKKNRICCCLMCLLNICMRSSIQMLLLLFRRVPTVVGYFFFIFIVVRIAKVFRDASRWCVL